METAHLHEFAKVADCGSFTAAARELHLTQSTLSNITSGRSKNPTVSTIKKICDGLDITLVEFFDTDVFKNLDQEIK